MNNRRQTHSGERERERERERESERERERERERAIWRVTGSTDDGNRIGANQPTAAAAADAVLLLLSRALIALT